MTYVVNTEVINPWGFCKEEPTFIYSEKFNFEWRVNGIDPITGDIRGHRLQIDIDTLIGDYVRRVYNLPDNTGVSVDAVYSTCLLYTSPSPRDRQKTRMPSSA